MIRLHGSDEESPKIDPKRTYEQYPPRSGRGFADWDGARFLGFRGKPKGLWWSRDGDWYRWLQTDEGWASGAHQPKYWHALELHEPEILQLHTPNDVRKLHSKYGIHTHQIDWRKVAGDYAGIEIPIIHDRYDFKDQPPWYYNLDRPSGVVWNLSRGLKSAKRFSKDKLLALVKGRM